ncbi:PREDICTED: probable serine/threonine-protein kinase clkA [Habropoda laboriosa]|uniref:probable serine/threonine-protein kinase clkA n=1 Tax=Habropoda laboriosa TaxID=597456 RepID=UPI00083DE83B|nr:PREDICTED: probable serine/threonine-protein kinase clkA [Habropoda laboriosa]
MHDRCEKCLFQEETYKETESIFNRSNDVKSKVAKWQNNNVENKYQSSVRQSDVSNEGEKGKEKYSKKIECQKSWEDQRMEELLENERKNSKNEINAKLNNQENYENAVIETKKSNSDDNPRKIKRIDLKAYGFENEFFSNRTIKTSAPRVVNKLDLKSFGYDDGIRRTQSNIQLNSIGSDEFKPRFLRMSNKSNLTRRNDYDSDRRDMIESNRASGDSNLTQSTEALNKFEDDGYDFGLKSAKSVPNIAKFYSNMSNEEDEEMQDYNQNSYNEIGIIKNGSVKNANNYKAEKCNIKSNDSSIDESENDTDVSSEREQSSRSIGDNTKKTLSDEEFDNKVLPMPSVRRLAQAFSKQTENIPASISKITKSSNVYKERSSTPEIQIVETPRQMHSLTARSLSKQFREGLRQIPNKVTSPPASHVAMEQPNIPENQTEVVAAKGDNVSNDTNVILPGKLKSNIIFWEQMQKKN